MVPLINNDNFIFKNNNATYKVFIRKFFGKKFFEIFLG